MPLFIAPQFHESVNLIKIMKEDLDYRNIVYTSKYIEWLFRHLEVYSILCLQEKNSNLWEEVTKSKRDY